MTVPAYSQLEADGLATLELEPVNGIYIKSLDPGFPTIRAVTDPAPDTDGELDQTKLIGRRAVTITGTIIATDTDTRQAILDKLRAFLAPGLRPYLVFQLEPDGAVRRIRLRADQHSAPILHPHSAAFQASWSGPDGIQEAIDELTATLNATTDVEAGRAYDLVFDRVYPASPPVGVTIVNNPGNTDVYPLVRLYGPLTGPNIENQTTGKKLELPGLVIAAGDYVELDTRNKTIRLLGDANQSRYQYLDFAESEWWTLVPGDNSLRYYPESFSAGATAYVIYRPAWL